jgi:hypothetical protein
LVEKKLPGKQWEFIVYDKLNRVVATGPSNNPFPGITTIGWIITKYDVYNRTVLTAWVEAAAYNGNTVIDVTVRKAMQKDRNDQTANFSESKATQDITINNVGFRYSNLVWPTANYHVLTVNYYDDYNFPNAPTAFTAPNSPSNLVYYNNSTQKPKSLPTGSWVRIPESYTLTASEKTHLLYDKKARPIVTYKTNYTGGSIQVENILASFSGKLTTKITTQKQLTSSTPIVIKEEFTYTPQDRLLTHTHLIGSDTSKKEYLTRNTYNDLGQLLSKGVGGRIAAQPLQKVDYSYNIRGWLTGINQSIDPNNISNPNPLNIA